MFSSNSISRLARRLRAKQRNAAPPFRCQLVRQNTVYLGSEYGGWAICPDYLSPSSVVYSFGIGEDASFDLGILVEYGSELHAFDPTPKSIAWVRQQYSWPSGFHFHPFGVGASDRQALFYPPDNPDHVSHSIVPRGALSDGVVQVQLLRLKTIAEMLGHERIAILKMDIEGAEYEVIDDIIRTPEIDIQQVVVEFHHFFDGFSIDDTHMAIDLLEMAGYKPFNISNRGVEYSFIRI